MPQLPTPFRAALGLVATALDTARELPEKAIELPMLAMSTAVQLSLRAQQRYTALAVRGDELLAGDRTADEPPSWARFDESAGDEAAGAEPVRLAPVDPEPVDPGPRALAAALVADASGRTSPTRTRTRTPKPAATRTGGTSADGTGTTSADRVRARAAKTVRAPRGSAPSRFDIVGDAD